MKPDWEQLREQWEADPRVTHGDIAKIAKVSRQAVSKRAASEGWKKWVYDDSVHEQAQAEADKRAEEEIRKEIARTDPYKPAHAKPTVGYLAEQPEDGISMRAKILDRHRKEWDGARNFVYKAIQNSDMAKAKLGKITAETLQIIQKGERLAWGLESESRELTLNVKREDF